MIVIFCGVPGSGKSTVAERLVQELLKRGKSCELFVSDETEKGVYDALFDFLQEKVNEVDCLVVDATFYRKKWRDRAREIAEGQNEDIHTAHFLCDLETCIQRNEERFPEERVPEKAIHIINSEMEKPESPDLQINTGKLSPEEAAQKILQKLEEG